MEDKMANILTYLTVMEFQRNALPLFVKISINLIPELNWGNGLSPIIAFV